MTAAQADFESHRSDTINYVITVEDSAGGIVSLLGASEITFSAAKQKSDGTFGSTAALVKTMTGGGIVVTDALNGVCQVELVTDDTKGMAPALYYYEVELIDASGDVGTVLIGTWTLTKDLITNA
jgi:hypothetical protein